MAVYPEVRKGVVILHGKVPDPQTAERVIGTIRSTPGVQRIISNLVVVSQQGAMAGNFNPAMMNGGAQGMNQLQQQVQQQMQPQQMQRQQLQQPTVTQQVPLQQQMQPQQRQNPQMQQFQQPIQQPIQMRKPQSMQPIPPQSSLGNSSNFYTGGNVSGGAKKKSANIKRNYPNISNINRRPAMSSPRMMSDDLISQYQDNDSTYVKYQAPIISQPTIQQPIIQPAQNNFATPVVSNPYIINIPSANAYQDNDSVYTPYTGGGGGSNPYNTGGEAGNSQYQDNDSSYDLIHYY